MLCYYTPGLLRCRLQMQDEPRSTPGFFVLSFVSIHTYIQYTAVAALYVLLENQTCSVAANKEPVYLIPMCFEANQHTSIFRKENT